MKKKEHVEIHGRVSTRHVITQNGRIIEELPARARARLEAAGVKQLRDNLVVNAGRRHMSRLLRGKTNAYINRVQLGDCRVDGVVRKTSYPPDLSDTHLVHEIRNLAGQPGATFDLDSDTSPDEITKITANVGTPGVLTAGARSLLTDTTNAKFLSEGIAVHDTVTVVMDGEDFTLSILEVLSASQLHVSNPAQLAGAVGYTVQTPGTQALFRKLISADNFPEASFGPVTVVHEAGLLFTDDTLFNRVTWAQTDDDTGLVLMPTDIDGTRVDVQLDWLITF